MAAALASSHPDGAEVSAAAPIVLGPERGLFVTAPARLILWAQQAMPGETATYARAPRLPRHDACAAAARMLAESGALFLFQARSDLPGLFDYRARRRSRAIETRPAPAELGADEERVLAILTAAAQARENCPSNTELAQRAGLTSKAAAAVIVGRLEKAGLIRREAAPEPIWRIVTIVESGLRTGAKSSVWL